MNLAERLPLNTVPSAEWQSEFERLMRDPYLAKKYNRAERLQEHMAYIQDFCPEVSRRLPGDVVDIGPGPGEFLELVRMFGNSVYGVDAETGTGGMGDGYLSLSRLLCARQRVPVAYGGLPWFVSHLKATREIGITAEALFNFRGSWAQCWHEHIGGEPHHLHHDVRKQYWIFGTKQRDAWLETFEVMHKRLIPGGHVLIAANRLGGSDSQQQYDEEIRKIAEVCGFRLVLEKDGWVHKWRKAG